MRPAARRHQNTSPSNCHASDSHDATPPPIDAAAALKRRKFRIKIGAIIAAGAMALAAALPKRRAQTAKVSNSIAPTRISKTFSVLTWNVWFGEHRRTERYDFLVSRVIELSPDVACFQEVTSPFLKALESNEEIQEAYYVTNNPISNYGIVSIVRKDIVAELEFDEVDLPSRMGRSLLVTKIPISVPTGSKEGDDTETHYIQVGNVHLESLANESLRRQQLDASRNYLTRDHQSQPTPVMLVGDFNMDSSRNWGDWDQNQLRHSEEQLENNVLTEVMPEWIDTWPYLKGDDPGLTFDAATNPNVRNKEERMRYDRIMVRMNSDGGGKLRLEPRGIEMVGTDAIDDTGLKRSDHYGLLMKADIIF